MVDESQSLTQQTPHNCQTNNFVLLWQRHRVQVNQLDSFIKRPYTCEHCKKYASTFEKVTQNHWLVCPFFPMSCPNNSQLVDLLPRQEMEHHMSLDCPFTLMQCDFHVVGCQVQLTRKDMSSHTRENLTRHMSLLQMHMTSHPEKNMPTYLWLMISSLQKCVLENASIRSELHEAQIKL